MASDLEIDLNQLTEEEEEENYSEYPEEEGGEFEHEELVEEQYAQIEEELYSENEETEEEEEGYVDFSIREDVDMIEAPELSPSGATFGDDNESDDEDLQTDEEIQSQIATIRQEANEQMLKDKVIEEELLKLTGQPSEVDEDDEGNGNATTSGELAFQDDRDTLEARVKEMQQQILTFERAIENSTYTNPALQEELDDLQDRIYNPNDGYEAVVKRLTAELGGITADRDALQKQIAESQSQAPEGHHVGYAIKSDGSGFDFDFFSTQQQLGGEEDDGRILLVSPRQTVDPLGQQPTNCENCEDLQKRFDGAQEEYRADVVRLRGELEREVEEARGLKGGVGEGEERDGVIEELQAKREEVLFFTREITKSEMERQGLLRVNREIEGKIRTLEKVNEEYAKRIREFEMEVERKADDELYRSDVKLEPAIKDEAEQAEIRQLKARIEDLQKVVEQYETEVVALSEVAQAKDTRYEELLASTAIMIESEKRMLKIEKELRQQLAESSSTSAYSGPSATEINLLHKSQADIQRDDAHTQLKALRFQIQDFSTQFMHLEKKTYESGLALEKEKEERRKIVADLQARIGSARKENHRLCDQIVELGGTVDNFLLGTPVRGESPGRDAGEEREREKELLGARLEGERLKGVVARLEVELEGVRVQERVLRREVQEVGRLEGIVERLTGESEVLKGKLSECEKDIIRLQDTTQARPDLSTVIPPTDVKVTTLFTESLDNLNTLMAQILDSKALEHNLSLLLQQLKTWLSTHESTLYTLLTEVKARESVIPDLEFRIADLRAENKGLYARLEEKNERGMVGKVKKVVRKGEKKGDKKAVGMRELNGLGDIPIVERRGRVTRGRPNYDEGHRKSVVSPVSEGFVEDEVVKVEGDVDRKGEEGGGVVTSRKGVVTGRVTKKKTAKGKRKSSKVLDPNFIVDLTAEVEEAVEEPLPEDVGKEVLDEETQPSNTSKADQVTKKRTTTTATTKKSKRKGAKALVPNFKVDKTAHPEEEDEILEADIVKEDLEVLDTTPEVKRGRKRKARVLDGRFVDEGVVGEEEEVLPL
ncbi:hypothetical protein GLAREA_10051 [Glarea lozoyensis ATCC 20868]|uniref:Uncharacterized protein n=1 Tax=Glarea lozoyensis (strain ATCC 20868 / MF5171) TaxID=1116229 RepID=S3D793_GLAL2|nr:uncharacterized protein GLAREA_10051 [Glarea lozoyensis ATCC 20868]EPE34357.1 hypothetical protein GLAREA_10051 [Glarea lozoyensis ATCC 20868]